MSVQTFLLDTNIVVAFLNGEEPLSTRVLASNVWLSSIVLGELFHGAGKSTQKQENWLLVEEVAQEFPVLLCDEETARFYGELKTELQLKGRPIPENDIWIAAIARQYEVVLVTRDAHFREVDGLNVEIW